MKRSFILLVAMVVTGGNFLFAQTVEQGRKFFYYERWKSAQETFEKVLAANPNNIDAVYWLGQTLLEQKDSIGAKNLYLKSLQQNGNAPLLLAGIGQVELMEGKANDARQRFETAITLTKGKDIEALNAVARANVKARPGDANYAIEKLNLATQVKGFKDPETYILMGDAYRKLIDGGNSVQSYNKAFGLDSKLAAAKFKIGKVYLTQGNKDFFLPNFEEAVALDPAYKPAYFELYYYWYPRDVNKAGTYLEQYLANADQGPEMEYLKTDYLYASSKRAEARAKAEGLIAQYGDKVNPRMYRLVAYAADTTGDAPGAKKAMETFLTKADEDNPVLGSDYEKLANINGKIPGNEAEVFANLEKAVALDTVVENKIKYINKAAALAKAKGDRVQEAAWLGRSYALDPTPTQTDLFNFAMANYQAKLYPTADSLFCRVYQDKFPDQIFGYLWCAKTKQAMDDSVNSQGLAVDAYKILRDKATQLDSVKFKPQIITSDLWLAVYYHDVKKEKQVALDYVNHVLSIDPANASALQMKPIMERSLKQGATPAQPANKPKPGGNAAGSGGTNKGSGK